MCLVQKMPKVDVKDPAPPPPPPEYSAAYRQGSPELVGMGRSRVSSNTRNKLRIDRNTSGSRNSNVPRIR